VYKVPCKGPTSLTTHAMTSVSKPHLATLLEASKIPNHGGKTKGSG